MNGTQALDGFLQSFKTVEPVWAKGGQAWLHPVRRAAIGRLEELGFPTTHDEDWRFTNLAPLVQTAFRPAEMSRRGWMRGRSNRSRSRTAIVRGWSS